MKDSIIKSTRELDGPPKSDNKLNYLTNEDLGNSNSDYMPDNDMDSVIETQGLGDLKSPSNRARAPTVKPTQQSCIKEINSPIHSFSV